MIVAVERKLDHIKEELEKRGYGVVNLGENQRVDAIVYHSDGRNMTHHAHEMSHASIFSGENISTGKGAFMVNANHKSIDEIDQMLKKRSYSPLFTGLE